MTQDKALVEEVAREILANGSSAKCAERVIAIVLERAAKVADEHRKDWHAQDGLHALGYASKLIRDDIRALMKENTDGQQ